MGRRTGKSTDQGSSGQLLTLDQIEASLGGGGDCLRQPGDMTWVRAAPAILTAMAKGGGAPFAALRCERLKGGLRILEGQDALLVARAIRARAIARGDLTWAALMGRQLVFQVAVGTATATALRRPPAGNAPRSGRRALAVAPS